MGFEDRVLTCIECSAPFTYHASEQKLHHARGYRDDPKRCSTCQEATKARVLSARLRFGRRGSIRHAPEVHSVLCADCGREARVPFLPRMSRPVYCSNCFQHHRTPGAY